MGAVSVNEWELKAHAASRRKRRMQDLSDGKSYGTRWIDPASVYRRQMKYRPQAVEDWEEVD